MTLDELRQLTAPPKTNPYRGFHSANTTDSANVTQLTPSRSSLWLNWRIARYGVTEQAREHGRAMVFWIFQYHPDQIVRETAFGMIKVLERIRT